MHIGVNAKGGRPAVTDAIIEAFAGLGAGDVRISARPEKVRRALRAAAVA